MNNSETFSPFYLFQHFSFYSEIGKWSDVEKDKSYCFKNKQDSNWVGIRYGWAIVTFKTKRARNKFLDNEESHFIRENSLKPYEKLKVSPWFDKAKGKQHITKQDKPTVKVPLYKSDLEKISQDPNNLTYEDFSRNSSDTSIQSFRGKIKSYVTNSSGLGHVGDIEVNVVNKNVVQSELVIFHSDCVWLSFGASESGERCGRDKYLPTRLKVGAEVYFTARKIPHGIVDGRRYQAKAVWLGQAANPKFITPTAASKLDEYLEDYLQETGQELKSKSSTPELESARFKTDYTDSGSNSPSPGITIASRQKPLKGGLNQLHSSQEKTKTGATFKKLPPTNFAQAVASAPSVIKEEQNNLILAIGTVESISSDTEAVILIGEYGTFNLHIKQLDLGFKPTHGINRYLTSKQSTLSVTLKQAKSLPGIKPKYEIVRAHVNEDRRHYEDKFDPFLTDFKPKTKVVHPVVAPDNWEDLADVRRNNNTNTELSDQDIDLDELDEYYDDLQKIVEYLEKELPKVIPTIANDKNCIQKLANKILSNANNDEAYELQSFLDHHQMSVRIKHIFIAQYLKFRNQDEKESFVSDDPPSPIPPYLGLSLSKFEKDFYQHQENESKSIDVIVRIIQFLRISEIKFEGLYKLYLRCSDDQLKSRYREFNQKIQNLLLKWANQKVLDDTNAFVAQKMKEFCIRDSHVNTFKRLDKFIPIVSISLCDFFEKSDKKASSVSVPRLENGEKEKVAAEKINGSPGCAGDSAALGKRKRNHDGTSVETPSYNEQDFVGFTNFLELAVASGRVSLAPTATVGSIIWAFQARNISYKRLEEIYSQSQQAGGCSWQFQISQLKLHPPLGVTVPEIGDFLSAYFGSVNNTTTSSPQRNLEEDLPLETDEEEEDDEEEDEEALNVLDEEELLKMIQTNLHDQYRDQEVTRFVKELRSSKIRSREMELLASYEELYSSHLLFRNTCWPVSLAQADLATQCSLISAGIWHDLNVTSDFLSMCVKNVHENNLQYQGVIIKWAKLLETSAVFNSSVLDIFTIVKATMLCYDENISEDEFFNISTNYCLYNVEGFVSHHLSQSFYAVQTKFALVVCHLGITYCQCCKDETFPLPYHHWRSCSLDSCLPIGSKVYLHSTGIKDPRGNIICQIADIVWGQHDVKYDPPETGIILPGNGKYKKYVQYLAEKYVAKTTPELFGDNNHSNNTTKYELMEQHYGQPVFVMADTWPHKSCLEMQKEFVFSEMGGMARPLLRSNWAGALNTSDQEKERLLNETFNYFQNDKDTSEMIEFIKPYTERAGLRNAMKILNQKYPEKTEDLANLNDTDSEKRKNLTDENEESGEEVEVTSVKRTGPGRNRQLSTDIIKDETLWMAENNLEQLWADETEQDKTKRMDELAEVNDDSEEYIEDEENQGKEGKQLGAIGSCKPKEGCSPVAEDSSSSEDKQDLSRTALDEKLEKLEAAVVNMSTWQPVASDIISGNRDLIMQLSSRIEFLETALNQLTLNLATSNVQAGRDEKQTNNESRKGVRSYVKIVKEGDDEDIAEVPTNSDGLLPQLTVTALFEGTSAIKYRVNSSKTWRALILEEDLYHPPEDGWGDRLYTCAQPQKTPTTDSQQSLGQFFSSPTSLDQVVASPSTLTYPLPNVGGSNSLVSPFMGLPMAQVWSTSVSPGQSVFGNIGTLGNIGNNYKNHPGTGGFAKNS